MSSTNEINDDLTKIPKLGSARQLWLAEAFGVHTYEDLAKLSVDEIEAQAEADGKRLNRSTFVLWPKKAAELAAAKKMIVEGNSERSGPKPTNQQTGSENNTSTPNTGTEQWHQVAFFNIEFLERRVNDRVIERKTHINYHETDHEYDWDGFETEQIGDWILEQAGDKLRQETREALAVEPEGEAVREAALPDRITVSVSGLHLYQPAGTEIPLGPGGNGRPYTGTVQAGQPFAVKAEFEIGDQMAASLGKREIPYQVQFYTKNRTTKGKLYLGDGEPGLMTSGKNSYSAKLGEILLSPGDYRLRVVVFAESGNVAPGYFELPRLRVIGE
jgi:hypothetical protein